MHRRTPADWPASTVTLTRLSEGVQLYFPPLRAWRLARAFALIGAAMLLPALLAATAFAPAGRGDARALLGFVLTATFVYPLIVFGAVFALVALYTISTSLTVTASATGVRAVRRLFNMNLSDRSLSRDAAVVLEQETQNMPRLLGGGPYFRVVALAATAQSGRHAAKRLVLADGIADEALADSIAALLADSAGIARRARGRDANESSTEN